MADKVFQIGFNRAGTRSISKFFNDQGHTAIHYRKGKLAQVMFKNLNKGREYSLFNGWPGRLSFIDIVLFSDMEDVMNRPVGAQPILGYTYFKELFGHYPGSKFIFNHRPLKGWINSRVRHFKGDYFLKWQQLTGKNPSQCIKLWVDHYAEHSQNVRDFFADYPDRLLDIDITGDNETIGNSITNFLPELSWDKDIKFGHIGGR